MNIKTNISFLVHAISSYNRVSKVHCLPRLDQPLVIISFRYADPVNINRCKKICGQRTMLCDRNIRQITSTLIKKFN